MVNNEQIVEEIFLSNCGNFIVLKSFYLSNENDYITLLKIIIKNLNQLRQSSSFGLKVYSKLLSKFPIITSNPDQLKNSDFINFENYGISFKDYFNSKKISNDPEDNSQFGKINSKRNKTQNYYYPQNISEIDDNRNNLKVNYRKKDIRNFNKQIQNYNQSKIEENKQNEFNINYLNENNDMSYSNSNSEVLNNNYSNFSNNCVFSDYIKGKQCNDFENNNNKNFYQSIKNKKQSKGDNSVFIKNITNKPDNFISNNIKNNKLNDYNTSNNGHNYISTSNFQNNNTSINSNKPNTMSIYCEKFD